MEDSKQGAKYVVLSHVIGHLQGRNQHKGVFTVLKQSRFSA